mmetsp:Transcript_2547/g.4713  ORF Transcript_2547/g.4713 Transcript_2547/m.4713 type:complete len:112 (+) Transcript_2547:95-430(+)
MRSARTLQNQQDRGQLLQGSWQFLRISHYHCTYKGGKAQNLPWFYRLRVPAEPSSLMHRSAGDPSPNCQGDAAPCWLLHGEDPVAALLERLQGQPRTSPEARRPAYDVREP